MSGRFLATTVVAALLLGPFSTAMSEPGDEEAMFDNPGVPPDYIGVWTGEGGEGPLSGIVTEAGFKFVHVTDGDQLSLQIGNFTSWQCIGPGELLYDLDWTLEQPDGTTVTERHCEFARVDLEAGTWAWASAVAPDCPANETDSQFWGIEQLVNSTLSTFPRQGVC